ncbi:MAG TPA: hypothetical protein VH593_28020 [Ktedonobacteraceae bacterium]
MNHHLPCLKIIREQKGLTPEQAAYARQFVQERIAAMLSTAAIDEKVSSIWLPSRVLSLVCGGNTLESQPGSLY